MKALLIGSTGLVGNELLQLLLQSEIISQVTVFNRRSCGLIHPKLNEELIDFNLVEQWQELVVGDVLFSCLGTTLKTAGSKEAQYQVDFTYQYEFAKAAAANGVSHYALVSSSGANAQSRLFYPRIKGELDEAVRQLNFQSTTILRPSLLLGKRKEKRGFEAIAQRLFPQLTKVVFQKYRPIDAKTVALALFNTSYRCEYYRIWELDEIFELTQNSK